MAFCVVIPAVLFLLGVPLFIEGRARGALSYMAIGFLLSVFAALMATGGFAMLFRPNKEEGARKARFDDAHWVMIQDKKKLEACQAEEGSVAAQVREALLELAQLLVLERSRRLLAVARDERHGIAFVEQLGRCLDLMRLHLELRRNLRIYVFFQHRDTSFSKIQY